jgi:hypothetical protein
LKSSVHKSKTTTALKDVWARIGVLLALLQHLERELNIFLPQLFAQQGITLEQIDSLSKSKRNKTLGELARALQQFPNFPSASKPFLLSFVEDRNRFVHRLFTEKDFDINNPKNVSRIRKFVDSMATLSIALDSAFYSLNKVLAGDHDYVPTYYGSFEWPAALKLRKGRHHHTPQQ